MAGRGERITGTPTRTRLKVARATALAIMLAILVACDSGSSDASRTPRSGPDFEVFMDTTATSDDVDAVRQQLRRRDEVIKIRYVSHEDAYQQFSRIFGKDQPGLVADTQPTELPESFRVAVSHGRNELAARVRRLQGVDMVVMAPSSRPYCRRLAEATGAMSRADRSELTRMTRCLLR